MESTGKVFWQNARAQGVDIFVLVKTFMYKLYVLIKDLFSLLHHGAFDEYILTIQNNKYLFIYKVLVFLFRHVFNS